MLPSSDRLTSPRWWPFWIAFAAALALRLLWLDVRPLHHDEGVNGWFLYRLLDGYRWEYDPEKFHGPFLYFFGAPFLLLLGMGGIGETALRLPVALASAAMVPLLLPLRRQLGRSGVIAAAWVLAVSPSLVSFGRDLIHETYLAALTLALIAAAVRWLEERRDRDLILAALALSLMLTVKETAVLTLASLAVGALAAGWGLPLPRAGEGRGEGSFRIWVLALALIVPYVLLYTSFLTNPAGLVDSFRAYLPWTQKGFEGSGHEKPWPYFLRLLAQFEPLALAGGVLGSAVALWRLRRKDHRFGLFVTVAWMAQLAAYSAIPYKTPWLAINLVLLLALAAGVLFGELGRRRLAGAARAAIAGAGLLAVAWSASRAVEVSFLRYDDETLGLVYVQTNRDLRDLMELIEGAADRSPQGTGLGIRFYTANRWPLPWYLRDYTAVLYAKDVPRDPEGDVLVCEPGQEQDLRRRLRGKYLRRQYTLRHKVELVVYVSERVWPFSA